jgi:hypothetical protein
MDRELAQYYEDRFSMMATPGWKQLIEDAEEMLKAFNRIDTAETFEEFNKRKGQVDILQWILTLRQVSEQTYEDLKENASI